MLPNVVLFEGIDSTGTTNLWETNGTASGTFELTSSGLPPVYGQPSITGEPPYGFAPGVYASLDLTVFNNQVLFVGRYTQTSYGLWTTDGTAADTVQLTGIIGANSAGIFTGATSSDFPDFTVYDGEVLFNGVDTAGDRGLWTTNGTAAGTTEVGGVPGAAGYTGISGAASTGVDPSDMTVFNGAVLFNGEDTAHHLGLWVTNGTAPGTHEITGIANASSTGIDPTDMTVFGNEVLFNGVDASGLSGLWVWNGTSATELVAGTGGASDPSGLDPTDITVLGNEVVFNGLDANGHQQLWVWNGTTAQQLSDVTGASTLEDASGIAPSDLTVFNGKVLFNGLDKNGLQQLWETNGTVAGTQEVAAPSQGLRPTNMEVYDGEVLFSGYDSSHLQGLWVTNGTAAGTSELTPTATAPYSIGLFPTDLTAIGTATPPNFFTSVAEAGVLWQNSNGDTELWNPTGSGGYAGEDLGVVGGGWQIAGTGAFNGASEASILWRNANGDTELWNPNGSGGYVGENLGVVDPSWQIAGTGDFTGTGKDSILWRNSGGDTLLWNPNGSGGFTGEDLGVVPTSWQVVGTGDFSGSGQSGILWRDSSGDTELWNPNGSGGFTGENLGVVPASWSVHKIFA
jgi:ELWxxDGT repeat protein